MTIITEILSCPSKVWSFAIWIYIDTEHSVASISGIFLTHWTPLRIESEHLTCQPSPPGRAFHEASALEADYAVFFWRLSPTQHEIWWKINKEHLSFQLSNWSFRTVLPRVTFRITNCIILQSTLLDLTKLLMLHYFKLLWKMWTIDADIISLTNDSHTKELLVESPPYFQQTE